MLILPDGTTRPTPLDHLRDIDPYARLGDSAGRRGQIAALRAQGVTDPHELVAHLDADDAHDVRLGFERLMGDRLTMPADGYEPRIGRVTPFDEALRSERSKRRGDTAAREARVDVIEKFWEAKRRRHDRTVLVHRNFAAAGVWSDAARSVAAAGPTGLGKALLLEHVVPASTVSVLVADLLRRWAAQRAVHVPGEPTPTAAGALADAGCEKALAELLTQVVTHVVITKDEDRDYLARTMTDDAEQALRRHYAGVERLSEDDLLAARWSRYLVAPDPDREPFPVETLNHPEGYRAPAVIG